jgi:hypothetical protein
MGYLRAFDMSREVDRGTALRDHFVHGHYLGYREPALSRIIELAEAALDAVAQETTDYDLTLPTGLTYRGQTTITVAAAIESLHLQGFVDAESDAPERT